MKLSNIDSIQKKNALSQLKNLNAAGEFLLNPFILRALFGIRISVAEISKAAGISEELIYKACDVWNIDINALYKEASIRAINATSEKQDPEITPYISQVKSACNILGWNPDKFVDSFKLFRSNRQAKYQHSIRRPKRYQRFQITDLCQLNLMEYFMLWLEHGRDSFHRHGKRKLNKDTHKSSALQVCRTDHFLPYTFDNCFIGTQSENMQEMHARENPGKSSGQCQIVIQGVVFNSRAEAKRILGKSESWLCSNEGDYKRHIYKVDECREILFEELISANDEKL